MISKIKLNLSGGFYEIIKGTDFSVASDDSNHLEYENDGVWYVLSDPDGRQNGNSVIMIPYESELELFTLIANDVAIKCDFIKAKKVYFDLKNTAGEFCSIDGGKIGISMGKGDARFGIKTLEALKVDCGYGTVNVDLPQNPLGYNITSACGVGEVTLNSRKLPREYNDPNSGKIINIVCGMGHVNINTYKKS